jgi:hypothetical protein
LQQLLTQVIQELSDHGLDTTLKPSNVLEEMRMGPENLDDKVTNQVQLIQQFCVKN